MSIENDPNSPSEHVLSKEEEKEHIYKLFQAASERIEEAKRSGINVDSDFGEAITLQDVNGTRTHILIGNMEKREGSDLSGNFLKITIEYPDDRPVRAKVEDLGVSDDNLARAGGVYSNKENEVTILRKHFDFIQTSENVLWKFNGVAIENGGKDPLQPFDLLNVSLPMSEETLSELENISSLEIIQPNISSETNKVLSLA